MNIINSLFHYQKKCDNKKRSKIKFQKKIIIIHKNDIKFYLNNMSSSDSDDDNITYNPNITIFNLNPH
jgi:hypothetical protein